MSSCLFSTALLPIFNSVSAYFQRSITISIGSMLISNGASTCFHKYFCLFSAVLLPIFELQLPIFNSVSAHFQQFRCLFIFNRYFYFLIAFMPIASPCSLFSIVFLSCFDSAVLRVDLNIFYGASAYFQ